MRDHKTDASFIAKALLNYNYRFKYLEEILHAAGRYINQGISEQEHTHLVRAIEKAKKAESFTSNEERSHFGLRPE